MVPIRENFMLLIASLTVISATIGLYALLQRKGNVAPAPVPVRVRDGERRARR